VGTRHPNLTAAGKGRKRGNPNKTTVAVKRAFELAFEGVGGVAGLTAWAKKNQTEFFKLYAKLLPANVKVELPPSLPLPDVVLTVEQATEVYKRVMGDPTLDIAQIEFAPQAPRQAALGPLAAPIGTPPTDAVFTEVPPPTDTTVHADRSNVVELTDKAKLWMKLGETR
jgi:hypothetical protein